MCLMNTDTKILAKQIQQQHTKKDHVPHPSGIHSKFISMAQHTQINQCNALYYQKKSKKTQDHLNRCRKKSDKIQHLFVIKKKTFTTVCIEETYLNIIKVI